MSRKYFKKVAMFIVLCLTLNLFSGATTNNANFEAATAISEQTAVNYLNGKVGQSYPNSMCLAFVADSWNALGAVRSSACCAFNYGSSHITSTDINNIPVGADVFFSNCGGGPCKNCGSAYYGHVGIYVGNGQFVHATGGKVVKSNISSWANKFRGWGFHSNVNIISNNPIPVNAPSINNVRITSIDANHISLNFQTSNSSMVRIVIISKTTGETKTTDYNSNLGNISYTFNTSSMNNPGRDFYVRLYAYNNNTADGSIGNECYHGVTFESEIGSVKLPATSTSSPVKKEPKYNIEVLPSDTTRCFIGWASGPENLFYRVTVVLNRKEYDCNRYNRPDIPTAFPGYNGNKAGFSFDFSEEMLNNGINTLQVRMYESDSEYTVIYDGTFQTKTNIAKKAVDLGNSFLATIVHVDSSNLLTAHKTDSIVTSKVLIQPNLSNPNQLYEFVKSSDGLSYHMFLASSGRKYAIDVYGGLSSVGNTVFLHDVNYGDSQRFYVLPGTRENSYILVPKCATGLCLNVWQNSNTAGAEVKTSVADTYDPANNFYIKKFEVETAVPTVSPTVQPVVTPVPTSTPTSKPTKIPIETEALTKAPSEPPSVELENKNGATIRVSDVQVHAGADELIPVIVSVTGLQDNPICSLNLAVDYDKTALQLESVSNDARFNMVASPLDSENVKVILTSPTKDINSDCEQLIILFFRLKENVKEDTYEIAVAVEELFDTKLEDVAYTTSSGSVTVTSNRIAGDATGDGKVSTKDANLIAQYVCGCNISGIDLEAADVDESGTVTLRDSTLILQKLSGWPVELK